MTSAYSILYDFALHLTGDRAQAKKIVDYVILEGARKLEQGTSKKGVEGFIVAEIRRMAYEYSEKNKRHDKDNL